MKSQFLAISLCVLSSLAALSSTTALASGSVSEDSDNDDLKEWTFKFLPGTISTALMNDSSEFDLNPRSKGEKQSITFTATKRDLVSGFCGKKLEASSPQEDKEGDTNEKKRKRTTPSTPAANKKRKFEPSIADRIKKQKRNVGPPAFLHSKDD